MTLSANRLIHRIYQDMDERQLRTALLRMLYLSEQEQISRDQFVGILGDDSERGGSGTCVSCHRRPGIRYKDSYVCVNCWSEVAG